MIRIEQDQIKGERELKKICQYKYKVRSTLDNVINLITNCIYFVSKSFCCCCSLLFFIYPIVFTYFGGFFLLLQFVVDWSTLTHKRYIFPHRLFFHIFVYEFVSYGWKNLPNKIDRFSLATKQFFENCNWQLCAHFFPFVACLFCHFPEWNKNKNQTNKQTNLVCHVFDISSQSNSTTLERQTTTLKVSSK